MNAAALIESLRHTGHTIPTLVDGIDDERARWRPEPSMWSMLEVMCHLADEEVEDFGRRLRLTIEDPAADWPPIDPEGVALERRYNEQDLAAVVARFTDAREASLAWLQALEDVDWSIAHTHPKFGSMSAAELLASWAAHDLLHLRQLVKRRFQLVQRDAAPHSTDYAGSWTT